MSPFVLWGGPKSFSSPAAVVVLDRSPYFFKDSPTPPWQKNHKPPRPPVAFATLVSPPHVAESPVKGSGARQKAKKKFSFPFLPRGLVTGPLYFARSAA